MFPYLGPPSPVLPPQPLPIVKTILAERPVEVEMNEVEPNWAGEIARLDRQWEDRFKTLDEQWTLRLVTLNRDLEP